MTTQTTDIEAIVKRQYCGERLRIGGAGLVVGICNLPRKHRDRWHSDRHDADGYGLHGEVHITWPRN